MTEPVVVELEIRIQSKVCLIGAHERCMRETYTNGGRIRWTCNCPCDHPDTEEDAPDESAPRTPDGATRPPA